MPVSLAMLASASALAGCRKCIGFPSWQYSDRVGLVASVHAPTGFRAQRRTVVATTRKPPHLPREDGVYQERQALLLQRVLKGANALTDMIYSLRKSNHRAGIVQRFFASLTNPEQSPSYHNAPKMSTVIQKNLHCSSNLFLTCL